MQYHTNEPFGFKAEYLAELAILAVPCITKPERYFLIAVTGDELLDWREIAVDFEGANQHVIKGSDHEISDFAAYADQVLTFCGIDAAGAHP